MIRLNLSTTVAAKAPFVDGIELFKQQGWQAPEATDPWQVLLAALKQEHWPLADNTVSHVQLGFVVERLDDEVWLHTVQELNRVCCDGALIHVILQHPKRIVDIKLHEHTAHALNNVKFLALSHNFRTANPQLLVSQYDAASLERYPVTVDWENNTFSLKFTAGAVEFMAQHNITQMQQQIQAVAANPILLEYGESWMIVHKNAGQNYGVVSYPNVDPFVMHLYPLDTEQFVSRLVKQHGMFETSETSCVLAVMQQLFNKKKKQAIAADSLEVHPYIKLANIGANLGWYALVSAQAFPWIKVDAFEPTPETVEKFRHSVELNGLESRISIHPIALSNEKTTCQLFVDGRNAGSNSLMEAKTENHVISYVIEIPADTLDNMYLSRPFDEWPDVIVMDVEGHEQKVLDGAQGMLDYQSEHGECWRPAIFAEFSPSLMKLRGDCTYYRDLIQKFGYRAFQIDSKKMNSFIDLSLEQLEQVYVHLKDNNLNDLHIDLVLLHL